MSNNNRPLSPHLQVYRPQLTSVLSIMHRGCGVVLAISSLLIAWWFWSAMAGADSYQTAHGFFNSVFGKILLIAWTACLFYHLSNGVRHLIWDTGRALELDQAYLAGKLVLASAAVLTILVWVL